MFYAVLERRAGRMVEHRPWTLVEGDDLTAGRSAQVLLGMRSCMYRVGRGSGECDEGNACRNPEHDRGVSAEVLTGRRLKDGWRLDGRHQNGIQIIPWAGWRSARPGTTDLYLMKANSRVAVHVASTTSGREHWLMLRTGAEDPGEQLPAGDRITNVLNGERPLAELRPRPSEREALQHFFADYFEWPPRLDAQPRTTRDPGSTQRLRTALQTYMLRCRSFAHENHLPDPTGLAGPREADRPTAGTFISPFLHWLADHRVVTPDARYDKLV